MGHTVKVSACTMNQWAMDFANNKERIILSIEQAKAEGCTLRVGSELEIPGYGCADHFLESDTFLHSWEVLADILELSKPSGLNLPNRLSDILILTCMPVMHRNTGYNCVLVLLNGEIKLIRPKMRMCDDGNYRESRWFTPWRQPKQTCQFYLPRMITKINGQKSVPFGDAVLALNDTCLGVEICEELWTPKSTHIDMALDGVEIICNSSGSHFELRKSGKLINQLVKTAVKKCGGIYIFSNQRGCAGDRLYYDGCGSVAMNGDLYARCKQFGLQEIVGHGGFVSFMELAVAELDLESVRTYRNKIRSSRMDAAESESYPRVNVDFRLSPSDDFGVTVGHPSPIMESAGLYSPQEEIAYGAACWLWDYLRRSKQGGFFVPLSGGRDSAAVVTLVYSMCRLVAQSVRNGDEQVAADIRRIVGEDCDISDPVAFSHRLLFTCYMATSNSSAETRDRAAALAKQVGAKHSSIVIDAAVSAILSIFTSIAGNDRQPKYAVHGGEYRENLALQNIQARIRMVLSYLFAQLNLWAEGRPGGLLVLATGNVDEGLRGYLTKYDCSSGDINPIGSISKTDLDAFLRFAMAEWNLTSLKEVLDAPATAELVPLADGKLVQTDEVEMGMSYAELSEFGRLRLPGGCGPYSMYTTLLHQWSDRYSPKEIGDKVMHFFRCYAINRHKATISTPAFHAEEYSPDDHRHDHRPFLYNVNWPWQFQKIKVHVASMEPQ